MKWIRNLLCRHSRLIVCSNAIHCYYCTKRWRVGMDSTEAIGVDIGTLMEDLAEARHKFNERQVWMPIDKAPTDQTPIVTATLVDGEWFVQTDKRGYGEFAFWGVSNSQHQMVYPSFWCHLPPPQETTCQANR